MHYPFCICLEKWRPRNDREDFYQQQWQWGCSAFLAGTEGAGTQFLHVLGVTNPAGWPTPSSAGVRSRGGSQPQTPHSFQGGERRSEVNGCKPVTAVEFLSVMKALQSRVLDLRTCGVRTSSHVAWKDSEVVVVCMWPLISLVILCVTNTKRRLLSSCFQS